MSISDPTVQRQKYELGQCLHESLHDPAVFYGQPTQRLAAVIAAQLLYQDRHTPWSLAVTIERIDELRRRLTAAKV